MDHQADQDRQLTSLQQQLAASHSERTAALEARVRAEQQVCANMPDLNLPPLPPRRGVVSSSILPCPAGLRLITAVR